MYHHSFLMRDEYLVPIHYVAIANNVVLANTRLEILIVIMIYMCASTSVRRWQWSLCFIAYVNSLWVNVSTACKIMHFALDPPYQKHEGVSKESVLHWFRFASAWLLRLWWGPHPTGDLQLHSDHETVSPMGEQSGVTKVYRICWAIQLLRLNAATVIQAQICVMWNCTF